MQVELREYNAATTIYFSLVDRGALDFEDTPVTIAAGDCQISLDGAGFVNTDTNFSHVAGGIYKLPLTAAEMKGSHIVIRIIDQTSPKEWEDKAININTYMTQTLGILLRR